jgi:hypothetical protein
MQPIWLPLAEYVFRKLLRTFDDMRNAAAHEPGDHAELKSRLAMPRMIA